MEPLICSVQSPSACFHIQFYDFQEGDGMVNSRETASSRFTIQTLEYSNVSMKRKWVPGTQQRTEARIEVHEESEKRGLKEEGGK